MTGIKSLVIELPDYHSHLSVRGAACCAPTRRNLYIFSGASIPNRESARRSCASTSSADAHDRVLAIGACLALEAQRVLKIERDNCRAREFQQEKPQRADRNFVCRPLLLGLRHFQVSLFYFGERGRLEPVEQVVRLHSESLPAADLDVSFLGFLCRELVSQFPRAPRCERHNVVRK